MSKFSGKIGFGISSETHKGRHSMSIVEKHYVGDIKRVRNNTQNADGLNDNLNVSVVISIVANAYANNNIGRALYAEYLGSKWKIKSVDALPPRLNLTLGDLYNGKT